MLDSQAAIRILHPQTHANRPGARRRQRPPEGTTMKKQTTTAKRPSVSRTRVQELGYMNHQPGHWQFVHEGTPIGRVYPTRAELLADVERVASVRGFTVEPIAATPARPAFAAELERFAAVRPVNRIALDGWRPMAVATGDEYIDLSTLSDTEAGARALAERCDQQNVKEIKARHALPFVRVARVQIEEML